MKNYLKISLRLTAMILLVYPMQIIHSQTVLNAGEIKGTLTKDQSPYLVKGDLNIPAGDSLVILPGVKVIFDGLYKINVQGYLKAIGAKNDSILFTVADTSVIRKNNFKGWGGIRFDRRPVTWDTIRTRMPRNEEARKIFQARIDNGDLDTTPRIILKLKPEDLVNDTIVNDSIFHAVKGSRLEYCRFEYATAINNRKPYVFGGAIYIYRYSNLIISNCTFSNNRAYAGGAIYCKEAAPVITNNVFTSCRAESSGGAMVFIHSGAFISGNTVKNNISGHNGGAVLFYESSPYVLKNTFINNTAENSGGAIYCENDLKQFFATGEYKPVKSSKYLREQVTEKIAVNSLINGNKGNALGKIINNVICDNKARYGGAVGLSSTAPELVNNTISNNKAEKGSGLYCYFSAPSITNSIIYGNIGSAGNSQIYLYGNSNLEVNYCNVELGISGIEQDTANSSSVIFSNNIDVSPMFKNPALYDYSLNEKSECIDAGTPDITSLSLALVDVAGKSRVINRLIDIGALEYSPVLNLRAKSTEEIFDDYEFAKELIVMVYPNPNYGVFSVTLHNNDCKDIQVNVFTQKGQLVYVKEFYTDGWFEKQIDLSGKSSGIYLILIHSANTLLYKGEIIIE